MRAYPSAAPVATPSNRVRTARISGTESRAATKCISEVPGLVKHVVTPASTSVRINAWAPLGMARELTRSRAEARRERAGYLGELGGPEHFHRFVEHRHPHQEAPRPGTAGGHDAGLFAVRLDGGRMTGDSPANPARRRGEANLSRIRLRLAGPAQLLPDVGSGVAPGNRPQPAALTGPDPAADPVDAKRPPVVAIQIERDQVPAIAAVDDGARLDVPMGCPLVPGHVREAETDPVAAGAGERGEQVGVDPRALDREGGSGRAERTDAPPQARGKHLLELGQRPNRRLLDPRDRARRGSTQPDRNGDRLGVIEQQRRELAAGPQAIAPGHPRRGLHRVSQRAQLVDVTSDRARPNLEPVRELLTGPFAADLEQRQEGEQTSGGLDHRWRRA